MAVRCVALCALTLCGGCFGWFGGDDDEAIRTDVLTPVEFGEDDIPLGPRIERGEPVGDATFANVQFSYDSFQVGSGEVAKIESVAEHMRQDQRIRLVVEGHCDERGSREYNMSLGEHRALAVRAYLVGLGIGSSRVQTKSYGEESPLDPIHNERAWLRNRRAEFRFYR